MRKNNSNWNSEFKYYLISKEGSKWYAWYYFDHRRLSKVDHEIEA